MSAADDAARALSAASRALSDATKSALRDAGKVAREELDRQAPTVPGPDKRFSRDRQRRALRVKVRVDRDGGARVSPQGVWGLAESGARPHAMPAWGRGRARHPGTQGRKSWTKGREAAFARLERDVPRQIGDAVERAFNG